MNLYYKLAGHNTRHTYWSGSRLARYIKKKFGLTQNPRAAELGEFKRIREENEQQHPYVAWFVDDGLDVIQDFVYFPKDVFTNFKYKFRARFVNKYFCIQTGLPKWEYSEVSERLLRGVFQTVVDFVEGEKAHMNDIFSSDEEPRIKDRREAGLSYLDWEIELGEESPYQSEAARVLKKVYVWYKDVRPNRPDPYDVSGWSEYCDSREMFEPTKTEEERVLVRKMITQSDEIEKQYDAEDEEMLISIIKIRQSMWT